MRKTWVYSAASLIILGAMATACGSKDEADATGLTGVSKVTSTVAQPSKESSIKTAPAGTKPSIDAQINLDGRNATISYKTSNFQLSTDHMDKKNVQGEGHLHLYVDGKQKAMLGTNAPVKLTNLTAGKHEIKLELQQNDHSDTNVEKIFNIEVK
ncbi:hypothetical protein GK047_22625 [Paenibacillus sp. SYP-B3998]|uniref:Uncharacterized protein n=1 Tax=Paenibacillus sp. SYP-B3998 TaxID=2678564 RepID=A0A6G4A328_9BACL|nr:hypothetical protein [Paenibacillus sp. SYP-B3998]NEW08795.1 hypothetical protein [Paenibacillus sp. SYP-B3998]